MAVIQFLHLSEKWALAYDRHQWFIRCREEFAKRSNEWRWRNVAFVASNRDTLLRVLRENGAEIDPDKKAVLMTLPHSFPEWLEQQKASQAHCYDPNSTIPGHAVGAEPMTAI